MQAIKRLVWIVGCATLVFALSSVPAEAQGRRRSPSPGPAPRAVIVGGYYARPFFARPFFDPWYSYPFFGYPVFGYPPFGPFGAYQDDGIDVRLQVTPRETQVYVDGFLAGTVDDFDGMFQRLHLLRGGHEIVFYLPNYRTVRQNLYLNPGGSHKIQHQMVPLGPGESSEPPPAPNGPPGAQSNYPPNRRPGPIGREPIGRQPAADRFGSLSIRVQPGDAEVTIDGEMWQGADAQGRLILQVTEGTHHVEVRKNGFETFSTDVQVRRGETTPFNVSLSGTGRQ